jgi:hypothetical protein
LVTLIHNFIGRGKPHQERRGLAQEVSSASQPPAQE